MVRFGIVGFGLHAVKRLMPGFALASRGRVVALSRRDAERARQSAREHGLPLAFDSPEQLCASPEVDAVFVASPDAFHLQHVLTALEHGKPVLCEKPMAMNADECRCMVEAARAKRLPLGVAQVFRFTESLRRMRQQLAAGAIGKPMLARVEFCFWGAGHARAWMDDPKQACGGPLADVGVHCLDALRFVLRDEVFRVRAHADSYPAAGKLETAAVMLAEFSGGTLGMVAASTRAPYRTPVEIVGNRGTLRAQDGLSVDKDVRIEYISNGHEQSETVSNREAYALQVDAFADAVAGRAPFPVPGEEGWRNQLVIDAAYRSVQTGCAELVGSLPPATAPLSNKPLS